MAVVVARCKSHRKCSGTHEVQVMREEDLDHQAVISTDLTYMEVFVSKLCYKISRKNALDMPGNYQ